MRKTSIVKGKWYETKQGVGECVSAGGTFPWSAQIRITQPFPRGTVNVEPRDVLREVDAPAATNPAPAKADEPAGELKSAEPKKSILGVTATTERKHGPHGPNCDCDDRPLKVSVEFDALVTDENTGKKIAEMFAAIAMIIKASGMPTRFEAGIYAREDDDKPTKREQGRPTLDPNLN